jgi:hypothetical protein
MSHDPFHVHSWDHLYDHDQAAREGYELDSNHEPVDATTTPEPPTTGQAYFEAECPTCEDNWHFDSQAQADAASKHWRDRLAAQVPLRQRWTEAAEVTTRVLNGVVDIIRSLPGVPEPFDASIERADEEICGLLDRWTGWCSESRSWTPPEIPDSIIFVKAAELMKARGQTHIAIALLEALEPPAACEEADAVAVLITSHLFKPAAANPSICVAHVLRDGANDLCAASIADHAMHPLNMYAPITDHAFITSAGHSNGRCAYMINWRTPDSFVCDREANAHRFHKGKQ